MEPLRSLECGRNSGEHIAGEMDPLIPCTNKILAHPLYRYRKRERETQIYFKELANMIVDAWQFKSLQVEELHLEPKRP